MKELIRFNISGVQYGDYQCCIGLKAGLRVEMFWEKSNRMDSAAIRIDYKGVKLGYVPKGNIQDLLHSYREAGIKCNGSISAYNKNNPTWHMFVVKVEVKRLIGASGNGEEKF